MAKTEPRMFRVALEVAGAEKAHAFYSKLLGMEGRRVGGGRVYFDCGPVILALVDVAAGRKKPKPISQDLSLAVSDIEAVHSRARALRCLSKENVHGEKAGALVIAPMGRAVVLRRGPVRQRPLLRGREDPLHGPVTP